MVDSEQSHDVPRQHHKCVYFRLADVFEPNSEEIVNSITPDLIVRGKVMYLTDAGENKQAYAVIEVEGLGKTVIVPMAKLFQTEPDNREPSP